MKINNLRKFIKQNLLFLSLGLGIVVFYFLSRLVNLTIIPVFADEAIYIRWAQVMRAVPSLRFIPLSDGKEPLFMWIIIPFLKVIADPLAAGRMVSVLAGFGTMVGIFVLSSILFKNKVVSLFASILYLITPFSFFFDRMALIDGLLSFFVIWFVILLILLVKNSRLDMAMIAGILLGLGLITKFPAVIFAILIPSTLILFPFKKGKSFASVLKIISLWLVVGVLAFSIFNILRLGQEFQMIAIRNKDFVFPVGEAIKHPLSPLIGNVKSVFSWYWILLTPITFLLGISGIILSLKKDIKSSLMLLVLFLVPVFAQSFVAKVYTARYILFSIPFILIFSAFALEYLFSHLKNRILTTLVLFMAFVFPMYQITLLSISPQKAWMPKNERSGYLELWTAGYGIKESAGYIKEVAAKQKVLVGTEGYFGTLPDGLQIYLEKVPGITVIGVGYPITEVPEKLKNGLLDNKVFLLVNDSRFMPSSTNNFHLIAKYPKAINPATRVQENLLFFEVVK